MKVSISTGDEKVVGSVANPRFLLSNNQGGYTFFGDVIRSRFEGVFFFSKNTMFKTIVSLDLHKPVKEVSYSLSSASRLVGDSIESFVMPEGLNALKYSLNKTSEFDIILDCRKSYDTREFGRKYSFFEKDECLIISFTKRHDNHDSDISHGEYDIIIAIHGIAIEYKVLKEWTKQYYEIDDKRHSSPSTWWVFRACRVRGKSVSFGFGVTVNDAIDQAKRASMYDNRKIMFLTPKVSTAIHIAYQCSSRSLDGLSQGNGIFAGFPWFFQHWTRDTLITIKGLLLLGERQKVYNLLLQYIKLLQQQHTCKGSLPYQPFSDRCCADGAGWLAKRILDVRELFHNTENDFSEQDKRVIIEALDKYIIALERSRIKDGLVINGKDETWMDTTYKNDSRDGARIEIHALALVTLLLYKELTGSHHTLFKTLSQSTKKFWTGTYLRDGIGDDTIRPNIFIAAYVYPELLSSKDWEQCFDTILPKLWLSWGGIASIDITHHLFLDTHSGQHHASYHRGDSWYWINNLAAIVLHRLNSEKYKCYVDKILEASTKEILFSGALGHHAELSSAKMMQSEGCISQSWSMAMYIELVNEMFD